MSANLPPFEQGRSFHSQFTARRMNDIQRAIPKIRFSGGGARVSNMGGQTFVQMPRVIPSPSAVIKFPFKISVRTNPADPSLYQAMIELDSTVMLSGKPNNNQAVTGLGVWFDFIANDVIALYIVVANYVATSATIQSYGMGTTTFDPTLAAWNAGDNSYVFDDAGTPPKQIGINILIGYSTPDAHGKPFLVQAQSTHVLLENCVLDGEAAIFDFSHRERYGITAP